MPLTAPGRRIPKRRAAAVVVAAEALPLRKTCFSPGGIGGTTVEGNGWGTFFGGEGGWGRKMELLDPEWPRASGKTRFCARLVDVFS